MQNETAISVIASNHDVDKTKLDVPEDQWLSYKNSCVYYVSSTALCRKKIAELVMERSAQTIFIIGIYSWFFNIIPILFSKHTRKILSVRGMLHPGATSEKWLKKKIYLIMLRWLMMYRRCEFHATSTEEEQYIKKHFGKKAKTWVAPNFPNLLFYQKPSYKERGKLVIISIALISVMKNYLLVLRALRAARSEIEYRIYGCLKDKKYWQQCEAAISTLPANITVTYEGHIPPAQIASVLHPAHVFILPSKSENYGHAIVEAMTAGKPVITSHNTPWNKLDEHEAGINVNPERLSEITKAVEMFANMDAVEYEKWSKGARKFADSKIDLENIKLQYRQMFACTQPAI